MREPSLRRGYSRRRLSPDELATWGAFLRAHRQVTGRLERELSGAGGLTLSEFDVLVTLDQTPQGIRVTELAERVLLTKSGVSRLLDRLEADGHLERRSCPEDRRGQLATITRAGRYALRRALSVHMRVVAEHFADRLDDRDRPVLRAALERISGPSGTPSPPAA